MKGKKDNLLLFNNLYKKLIPKSIDIYAEPFGGTFGFANLLRDKDYSINRLIYNDMDSSYINEYEIVADSISHLDFRKFINKHKNNSNVFMFIDPPYYNTNFYKYNFINKDHDDLKYILDNIKFKFVLCYYDDEYILNLYKRYRIVRYPKNSVNFKREIAITNI